MKMRKIFSLLLCFVILFSFASCKKDVEFESTTLNNESETEIPVITQEVDVTQVADFEAKDSQDSQVGLIVDSWLKVVSIGESKGRVSVFVRNIADFDVQYAVLSVVCDDKTLSFPMSTITAGANAVLTCDNDVKFDENAQYHTWKISDKVIFQNELSLYPEIFEINGEDGVITVKNISKKDIKGDIYIYFKTVSDGIFAEGTTYRVSINGLDKGKTTRIMAEHFKKDTSKVMFVTYVQ